MLFKRILVLHGSIKKVVIPEYSLPDYKSERAGSSLVQVHEDLPTQAGTNQGGGTLFQDFRKN